MFKDLLDKGKCLIGFHQGEWRYASANGCAQTHVCARCGAVNERIEHVWSEWSYSAAGCEQARVCQRCAVVEERTEHVWNEPAYLSANACNRAHTCGRCKQQQAAPELHVWNDWEYLSPRDCTQARHCGRCRAQSQEARALHEWEEWRYSEEHRGPVRGCRRCGSVANREGAIVGKQELIAASETNTPSSSPEPAADPALSILQALGNSIAYQEHKGDFAEAGARAESTLRAARGQTDAKQLIDALVMRAIVHWLSAESIAAVECAEEARRLASPDAGRSLRALTYKIIAGYEQYNSFPDGNGAGATEINARWRTETDLQPLDAEWHDLFKRSADPLSQNEAWMVYQFLWSLWPARNTLENMRYAPASLPREAMMQMYLDAPNRLRSMSEANGALPVAAFADWAAADLWRRAGDAAAAGPLLERALQTYRQAGDKAGEAFCLMTRADWQCAPCSTPLAWNFAIVDSSSQGSHLSFQQEADEFKPGAAVSYAEAETLFEQAGAPRGVAAIQLRHGYQAMLAEDWAAAARHAIRARDGFANLGDARGERIAETHLAMCQLAAPDLYDADPLTLARELGAWGAESGNFSFTLGLGILLNRFARHWLVRRGDYERALAASGAARVLFESLGARINAAQCLVDQGVIYQAAGDRKSALTLFERALDDTTNAIDAHPRVADSLRQRVIFLATDVYQLSLQQTDADGMERSAARLQRQLEKLPGGQIDLEALMASFASGSPMTELPAGVEFMALRQMAESIIRQSSVLAPLYRARWKKNAGDPKGAAALLDRAALAAGQMPEGERYFLETVVLGEQKKYSEAAEKMRRYLAAGGADAGFAGRLTEVMKQHGGAHGQAEAALQLRRTHEQAFSLFVMIKQYEDAAKHLRAIEQLAGEDWWKSDAKPWQPLSDCAEMHAGLNDPARALACYDQAIEQLEARRLQLSRDELKTALASDKGAQFLYFLAARTAMTAGDAARAFEYAERGKARALLDLMAAARIDSSPAESGSMRAWRQANAQLSLHRGLLAQARSQQTPDAARIAGFERQVVEDEAGLRRVESELAQSNPKFHEAINPQARTMTLDEIRAALPPKTALIEYFFLGEDLLAWAITNAGVQTHHASIEAADLARRIGAFHRACKTRGAHETPGKAIADALLAPFADLIRANDRLIVVPYGAAHALPFQALPFDGEPLAAHRSVSYLPSASALQFLRGEDSGGLPEKILVVGNPTGDLAAAEAEAEFVAEQFPQSLLLKNADATEARVRECIADYPLLHFATHGNLSEDAPLESSLSFAAGESLTVYELMGLRLQARLVVLSACDTAQGETTGGDDVLGLTRGLLAAGARAAIVSLWPVDDYSTGLLMREFYRCLRRGDAPDAALRNAQNRLRQMTEAEIESELSSPRGVRNRHLFAAEPKPWPQMPAYPGYSHPFHWAPFILVG